MDEVINAIVARLDRMQKQIDALSETLPQKASVEIGTAVINGNISDTQDALCETSIDVDERITTIEDALCELSKEE